MFGQINITEIAIILALITVVFGGKKVGEMAREAGQATKKVRQVKKKIEQTVKEVTDLEDGGDTHA